MIKIITIALLALVGCVDETTTELPTRPQLSYPVVYTGLGDSGERIYLITAEELQRLHEQADDATRWMRQCAIETGGSEEQR